MRAVSHRPAVWQRLLTAAVISAGSGAAAAAVLLASGWFGWLGPMTGPVSGGGWTDRSRAWFTARGFFSTEIDQEGRQYTWTSEGVRVVVPYLDRSQPHELAVTLAAGRADGAPLPTITPAVDGVAGAPVEIPNTFTTFRVAIPATGSTRAVVTLRVNPTFDPGPHDERMLGVIVRELRLTPASGTFTPSLAVAGWLAVAVAAVSFGLLLCGLHGLVAVAAVSLTSAVFVWLTMLDGAFLGPFVDALVQIGVVALLLGFMVLAARSRAAQVPDWAVAVGLILAGTLVKLAIVSHPQITVGDGIFQVHRAHMVRGGQYFFTSITPRPFFEFPYAVGLYVTAMPFWSWFPRELDQLWLLRTVVLVADGLAGVALFAVARRAWPASPAPLLVAGLWPFARAPFEALCNANLTNAFGQSVFGVAMAGLAWIAIGGRAAPVVALGAAGVLAASFLSHFSTLSVGVPLVGAVAALLLVGGRPEARWKGAWIALVCLLAIGVSYAVYYRHFGEVYRQTVERVMSDAPVETTGSSIAASPGLKLRRWLTGGSDDYGLPGAPLALATSAGVVVLWRNRRRDAWTLVLAAWLAVWVGFTALGILTSVQMRVNLAAAPMFVCVGAYAIGQWSAGGPGTRAAAIAVALLVVIDGMRLWLMCVGR